MVGFILADQNTPFAVALGLMMAIALAEGVGTLMGLGLSSMIDSLLPEFDLPDADIPDFDGPEFDMETPSGVLTGDLEVVGANAPDASGAGQGLFSQFLGWLCFGRVPALIILVLFLTGFGVAGYVLQGVIHSVTGWLLPGALASAGAFAGALPFTRVTALGLAKIMPTEETDAVSRKTFVGKPAIIVQGNAEKGLPAQARLKDHTGQSHYVLVEPDEDGVILEQGSEIIIVRQVGARFAAIRNTNESLSGSAG